MSKFTAEELRSSLDTINTRLDHINSRLETRSDIGDAGAILSNTGEFFSRLDVDPKFSVALKEAGAGLKMMDEGCKALGLFSAASTSGLSSAAAASSLALGAFMVGSALFGGSKGGGNGGLVAALGAMHTENMQAHQRTMEAIYALAKGIQAGFNKTITLAQLNLLKSDQMSAKLDRSMEFADGAARTQLIGDFKALKERYILDIEKSGITRDNAEIIKDMRTLQDWIKIHAYADTITGSLRARGVKTAPDHLTILASESFDPSQNLEYLKATLVQLVPDQMKEETRALALPNVTVLNQATLLYSLMLQNYHPDGGFHSFLNDISKRWGEVAKFHTAIGTWAKNTHDIPPNGIWDSLLKQFESYHHQSGQRIATLNQDWNANPHTKLSALVHGSKEGAQLLATLDEMEMRRVLMQRLCTLIGSPSEIKEKINALPSKREILDRKGEFFSNQHGAAWNAVTNNDVPKLQAVLRDGVSANMAMRRDYHWHGHSGTPFNIMDVAVEKGSTDITSAILRFKDTVPYEEFEPTLEHRQVFIPRVALPLRNGQYTLALLYYAYGIDIGNRRAYDMYYSPDGNQNIRTNISIAADGLSLEYNKALYPEQLSRLLNSGHQQLLKITPFMSTLPPREAAMFNHFNNPGGSEVNLYNLNIAFRYARAVEDANQQEMASLEPEVKSSCLFMVCALSGNLDPIKKLHDLANGGRAITPHDMDYVAIHYNGGEISWQTIAKDLGRTKFTSDLNRIYYSHLSKRPETNIPVPSTPREHSLGAACNKLHDTIEQTATYVAENYRADGTYRAPLAEKPSDKALMDFIQEEDYRNATRYVMEEAKVGRMDKDERDAYLQDLLEKSFADVVVTQVEQHLGNSEKSYKELAAIIKKLCVAMPQKELVFADAFVARLSDQLDDVDGTNDISPKGAIGFINCTMAELFEIPRPIMDLIQADMPAALQGAIKKPDVTAEQKQKTIECLEYLGLGERFKVAVLKASVTGLGAISGRK